MSAAPFARRLLGFTALPLISMLVPFALLPIIARVGGVDGWASFAIGQSLGGFAGIAAGLGWAVSGPALVAAADDTSRALTYRTATASRIAALAIAAPAACLVAALTAPQIWTAILATVSGALIALSPAWYCIGIGKPSLLARYEVAPRVGAALVSLPAVLITGVIALYPALLIVATVTGLVLFKPVRRGAQERHPPTFRQLMSSVWEQRLVTLSSVMSGAYTALPTALVAGYVTPLQLSAFVSGEKTYKISLFTISSLTSAFQGWVSEAGIGGLRRRGSIAVAGNLALGLFGGVFIFALGPAATSLLFGNDLAADPFTCLFLGVAFLAVSLNSAFGRLILAPRRRYGAYLASTAAGALVGVPSIVLLSPTFGASGGAAGVAFGEMAVLGTQLVAIAFYWRRNGRANKGAL